MDDSECSSQSPCHQTYMAERSYACVYIGM